MYQCQMGNLPSQKLSNSYQTIRYLITGELYSVTIYMNYHNRFLCETNLTKITIFYLQKITQRGNQKPKQK